MANLTLTSAADPLRRIALAALLGVATLSLSGCVGLTAKAKPVAASQQPKTATEAMAQAESSKAPAPGGYVDPMVAAAGSQATKPKSRAYRPPSPLAGEPAAPGDPMMQMAQLAPEPQNLGEIINQPTTVQAGNNSIFALATARVDAANAASGAAAYAPPGRINPMMGSVFSARASAETVPPAPVTARQPAAQPVAQPAARATGTSAKDGLW
jgi:hypothetical protein